MQVYVLEMWVKLQWFCVLWRSGCKLSYFSNVKMGVMIRWGLVVVELEWKNISSALKDAVVEQILFFEAMETIRSLVPVDLCGAECEFLRSKRL